MAGSFGEDRSLGRFHGSLNDTLLNGSLMLNLGCFGGGYLAGNLKVTLDLLLHLLLLVHVNFATMDG